MGSAMASVFTAHDEAADEMGFPLNFRMQMVFQKLAFWLWSSVVSVQTAWTKSTSGGFQLTLLPQASLAQSKTGVFAAPQAGFEPKHSYLTLLKHGKWQMEKRTWTSRRASQWECGWPGAPCLVSRGTASCCGGRGKTNYLATSSTPGSLPPVPADEWNDGGEETPQPVQGLLGAMGSGVKHPVVGILKLQTRGQPSAQAEWRGEQLQSLRHGWGPVASSCLCRNSSRWSSRRSWWWSTSRERLRGWSSWPSGKQPLEDQQNDAFVPDHHCLLFQDLNLKDLYGKILEEQAVMVRNKGIGLLIF